MPNSRNRTLLVELKRSLIRNESSLILQNNASSLYKLKLVHLSCLERYALDFPPTMTFCVQPFVLSTPGRQWIFGGDLSRVEGRSVRPFWALLFTDLLLFAKVSRDRVIFVTEEPLSLSMVSQALFSIRKKGAVFLYNECEKLSRLVEVISFVRLYPSQRPSSGCWSARVHQGRKVQQWVAVPSWPEHHGRGHENELWLWEHLHLSSRQYGRTSYKGKCKFKIKYT